ncbi:unnamed protein product, partial [Heterosigma akashiwo]
VKKIFRLTNRRIAQEYVLERSTLLDEVGENDLNERNLFHGTKSLESVVGIAREGFDWRLNGTHGTCYGKGSYFSADLAYSSENFTQAKSKGVGYVFIARVLLGKSAPGKVSDVRAPPGFHSTVAGSNIYVTFHMKQAYPQYLVCF